MKVAERDSIVAQMGEPMPLPMGRTEFEAWAARIISGALIPDENGKVLQDLDHKAYQKLFESQKFALAGLLMGLGPTESHKPDAYFIHALRVSAVKQVAVTIG